MLPAKRRKEVTSEALTRSRAVLEALFGVPDTRSFDIRFWNGTIDRGDGTGRFALSFNSPHALRRMLFPPTELSIVEAVIRGDVDIIGNVEVAAGLSEVIGHRIKSRSSVANLARLVLALPHDRKDELDNQFSARAVGRQHDPERDAAAIQFHYDVGNDFYRLWLDERMVYSCAYFQDWSDVSADNLDAAQEAKLDLVCRKLRLHEGERFLDIGCGWGALIIHAAEHYGVTATGITLSKAQESLARERIAKAGLNDRCTVEIRDYRTIGSRPDEHLFDKISSIGMVEHVGEAKLPDYFDAAFRSLAPGGLFLNHGIVSLSDPRPRPLGQRAFRKLWRADAFIDKYVFPDGKLLALHKFIATGEGAGFETRDVESLREHYARTLRLWVRRLEQCEREAIATVGERTYRVWRIYMSAAARAFATAGIGVVQTVFAKPDEAGRVAIPPTRNDILDRQLSLVP